MKSSRYIQNTDLATLKNDGKTSVSITIPQTATIQNGVSRYVIASTNFMVGNSKSEPQFIYELGDGSLRTNNLYEIPYTLRQYSTIDNQWHNTTQYYRAQVVRTGESSYRLEAYLTADWTYSRYNATATFDSQAIKLYVHTFLNPFSQ